MDEEGKTGDPKRRGTGSCTHEGGNVSGKRGGPQLKENGHHEKDFKKVRKRKLLRRKSSRGAFQKDALQRTSREDSPFTKNERDAPAAEKG